MKAPVTVGQLCRKLGMSRQKYYKGRRERQRPDSGVGSREVCGTAAAWRQETPETMHRRVA
jgi:hypothetical protein